ncbi:hypothetical protein BT93_A1391 [Corymbia citriodora subsp. variegata]|nr:hypothetical protein BT93_A1391 [Corymbia citriodora subsp. variegata]
MSLSPLVGVLRLSTLSVEWPMVKMRPNGKLAGSNGKLQASLKLTKGNEPIKGHKCMEIWRRKLIFFCLLLMVASGVVWFFSSFSESSSVEKPKNPELGEEKARIFTQHFNVSKNQLHALASLLGDSDQVASVQCSKLLEETGKEMTFINGCACSLKVVCSEHLDLLKQQLLDGEYAELKDQCPVQPEHLSWEDHLSMLQEKSIATASLSEISFRSVNNLNVLEDTSQARGKGNHAGDSCGTRSFGLVKGCWWVIVVMIVICKMCSFYMRVRRDQTQKTVKPKPMSQQRQQQQNHSSSKSAGSWRKKLLIVFVVLGVTTSFWLFWHLNAENNLRREETLANMCDERARMLQDQFNVSMNHVHALAILVSTFHHGKQPSAIDQKTFGEYTERTAFERPLTSGVAYALKVPHSERQQFEKRHEWTIKKMETADQTLVQDYMVDRLDPAPIQDEYAPVVFSQETVSHIVSIDMMSGKEDRENILRARASGKGVLTSPFKLLKSNHLGVVLTFAVYDRELPADATAEQRIEATVGYLGASYDVPSLVEKLLHQLASKQTIVVNVYDTTNGSAPINMYGDDVIDTGLVHVSNVDFGDPLRRHEMHCRFKQRPPWPWTAINSSVGLLVITLLVGHIFHAAINRIAKVEEDYRQMMELKSRAEAADVAKSQFLATVSHEIRTPMNGVLGMLQMLMDTNLDANQLDYAQTAHACGKDLISLINEVLDQAKIESGRLELEKVPFDLRSVLDNVLSLFSGRSNEKGIELAVYVSDRVPDVVIGDPGRFRQIITNLVGNSIKFTHEGHIFVSVYLVEDGCSQHDFRDAEERSSNLVEDTSNKTFNTLSGFRVVDRRKSWEHFRKLNHSDQTDGNESVEILVTVEDTGVGIAREAQSRIFTPFVQADSSTSRTYGGTGIGLSISKCLVDLMHGEIGFVSEPGTGSTFSFTVPLAKCEMNCLDMKWQNYDSIVSEFRGLRALVIDKRSIRAEVARYHLERLKISVDIACSLMSACTYLSNSSSPRELSDFDMILIDKDVWDRQTGSELNISLKKRRQNGSNGVSIRPKIFLLATSISPSERSELKLANLVDNVLVKPLRLSVLMSFFQEALGNGKKRLSDRRKVSSLGNLLKDRRILVVDDNMVNRRVAEGALKKYGAIVTCVGSGKDAVAMLRPPHDFAACFMDLQMPEMDGFEATRQIRHLEREVNSKIATGEASSDAFHNVVHWHTPILAMTADVIQATNEECVNCGMDDYVSKPFEEEQLYSAVARFFESG